jgi:hypothetical protein
MKDNDFCENMLKALNDVFGERFFSLVPNGTYEIYMQDSTDTPVFMDIRMCSRSQFDGRLAEKVVAKLICEKGGRVLTDGHVDFYIGNNNRIEFGTPEHGYFNIQADCGWDGKKSLREVVATDFV